MASETLQAWIEIPSLPAPPLSAGEWLVLMLPWLITLCLFVLLLWWLLRQPRLRLWSGLSGIRRALLQHRLSERQALFALAQLIRFYVLQNKQKPLPDEIEQILVQRFNKTTPSQAELLVLIKRLQTWIRV